MENLEGMIKLVDKEFGEMVRNGKFRSKDDVDLVYKMMDIVKDGFEVMECENKLYGGYSEGYGYPYDGYNNGNSYARGRSMPRNSMGRFTSREPGWDYSRTDAKSEFMNHLHAAMQSATDDHTRDQIQRMIRDMEQ